MSLTNLKIVIADDHQLFRQGIKQMLLECSEIERVDDVSTGREAIQKISDESYDCVLLDIFMPGRSGLEVLKQINEFKPDLPVLILSMYPEDIYGIRSIKAGARGYLKKNCSLEELKSAIFQVCVGKKYITSKLGEALADEFSPDSEKKPHELLTDRQFQIMKMIASGKPVSQIAQELSLSIKTINVHRANILRKMNMKNNAQLIKYALNNRIIF